MTFSYTITNPLSDRDWVRLKLGETIEAQSVLADEEIDAILAEEPNKQYAAASLGEAIFARWQAKGAGVVEKRVGRLAIRRGDGESAGAAWRKYCEQLRREGARALMPRPKVFRAL